MEANRAKAGDCATGVGCNERSRDGAVRSADVRAAVNMAGDCRGAAQPVVRS